MLGLLWAAAAWSSSGRAGLLLRAGARRRGRGLAGSRRCGGERARGRQQEVVSIWDLGTNGYGAKMAKSFYL